jgi:hypothetical protein
VNGNIFEVQFRHFEDDITLFCNDQWFTISAKQAKALANELLVAAAMSDGYELGQRQEGKRGLRRD